MAIDLWSSLNFVRKENTHTHTHTHVYMGWVQVTLSVILNNVTPPDIF